MRKTEWRTCYICGVKKRSTNEQTPYIGEECYKTIGREMMLDFYKKGIKPKKAMDEQSYRQKIKKEIEDSYKGTRVRYFVVGLLVTLVGLFILNLTGVI